MHSCDFFESRFLAEIHKVVCSRCRGGVCGAKRFYARARDAGELLLVKRLCIFGFQPSDGSCRSVSEIARRRDGAEPCSLWSSQDAVDDFPLDQI